LHKKDERLHHAENPHLERIAPSWFTGLEKKNLAYIKSKYGNI
tara:strand:+ start:325 stop:453 length:129 start_codon:yes stop_codon:yes gene_type:complete